MIVEDITQEHFLPEIDEIDSFENVIMSDERKKAMKVINFTFIRNDSSASPLFHRGGSSGSVSSPTKSDESPSVDLRDSSSRLSIA